MLLYYRGSIIDDASEKELQWRWRWPWDKATMSSRRGQPWWLLLAVRLIKKLLSYVAHRYSFQLLCSLNSLYQYLVPTHLLYSLLYETNFFEKMVFIFASLFFVCLDKKLSIFGSCFTRQNDHILPSRSLNTM